MSFHGGVVARNRKKRAGDDRRGERVQEGKQGQKKAEWELKSELKKFKRGRGKLTEGTPEGKKWSLSSRENL